MSREIPYEPMHVRKYVSFARMQEILAKHAPKGAFVNNLSDELWLASKIRAAGGQWEVFGGLTTRDERREKIRSALKAHGLSNKKCGKRSGQEVSFGQIFEVIYGQPL